MSNINLYLPLTLNLGPLGGPWPRRSVSQRSVLICPCFTACRWRQRWQQLKRPSPAGLSAARSSGRRSSTSWLTWWKPTWRSLPRLSPETKVSYYVLAHAVSAQESVVLSVRQTVGSELWCKTMKSSTCLHLKSWNLSNCCGCKHVTTLNTIQSVLQAAFIISN